MGGFFYAEKYGCNLFRHRRQISKLSPADIVNLQYFGLGSSVLHGDTKKGFDIGKHQVVKIFEGHSIGNKRLATYSLCRNLNGLRAPYATTICSGTNHLSVGVNRKGRNIATFRLQNIKTHKSRIVVSRSTGI